MLSPMVKTAEVIQIVPRLPPPEEGVGSFALALAGALRDGHGIASRFAAVAASPAALGEALAGADVPVLDASEELGGHGLSGKAQFTADAAHQR